MNRTAGPIRRLRRLAVLAALLVAGLFPGGCGQEGDATLTPAATPTTAVSGEDYVFAVMGDSHTDGLDSGILAGAFASAVERGAEFIIHTGDVSNVGADGELRRYRQAVDMAPVPVYTLPGNHDTVSDVPGRSLFEEIVGPRSQDFVHQGDHFLLVDYSDVAAGVSEDQLAAAAAAIASAGETRWLLVFTHIPLGGSEGLPPGLTDVAVLDTARDLAGIAAEGDVDAYFAGHLHGYAGYRVDGVDAWISGGAGGPPFPLATIGYYHYLLVSVESEGIAVEVVRL